MGLAVIREKWNGVRMHAGIGYVTPNDEHEGRGSAVRKAREAGLEAARLRRLSYQRNQDRQQPSRTLASFIGTSVDPVKSRAVAYATEGPPPETR